MTLMLSVLQFGAALLFALVAGSVFGIWRGYDPSGFTAAAFVEMHQGSVRGLNVLLPGLALVSIVLTIALGWFARGKGAVLWLYVGAVALMIAAGLVTRFVNQPINGEVMSWTAESVPANWMELRSTWWNWHVLRTGLSVGAFALLLAAIILDRKLPS